MIGGLGAPEMLVILFAKLVLLEENLNLTFNIHKVTETNLTHTSL